MSLELALSEATLALRDLIATLGKVMHETGGKGLSLETEDAEARTTPRVQQAETPKTGQSRAKKQAETPKAGQSQAIEYPQLVKEFQKHAGAVGVDAVVDLLARYGCQSLRDLPTEKYEDFVTEIREANSNEEK